MDNVLPSCGVNGPEGTLEGSLNPGAPAAPAVSTWLRSSCASARATSSSLALRRRPSHGCHLLIGEPEAPATTAMLNSAIVSRPQSAAACARHLPPVVRCTPPRATSGNVPHADRAPVVPVALLKLRGTEVGQRSAVISGKYVVGRSEGATRVLKRQVSFSCIHSA
eukprot:scaffold14316_cov116-Isochrysis_galbana.AAC.3